MTLACLYLFLNFCIASCSVGALCLLFMIGLWPGFFMGSLPVISYSFTGFVFVKTSTGTAASLNCPVLALQHFIQQTNKIEAYCKMSFLTGSYLLLLYIDCRGVYTSYISISLKLQSICWMLFGFGGTIITLSNPAKLVILVLVWPATSMMMRNGLKPNPFSQVFMKSFMLAVGFFRLLNSPSEIIVQTGYFIIQS